jgi:hypothetical protein
MNLVQGCPSLAAIVCVLVLDCVERCANGHDRQPAGVVTDGAASCRAQPSWPLTPDGDEP